MLRLIARTVSTALRAEIRKDGSLILRTTHRVGLDQIDLNAHMNQSMYAQEMELARTNWAFRSGAWDAITGAGARPVVAEQRLIYRRELKPLQRYTIDTRAVAVDGKLLRLENHLIIGDRVHAKGEVALIFPSEAGGVLREPELIPLLEPFLADPLAVEDWRVIDG